MVRGLSSQALLPLHKTTQLGFAHAHISEKQTGVEGQLHALLRLAQLGALEEGCVHLE